jgi:alkylated DNA repair dioxygenase AlkB
MQPNTCSSPVAVGSPLGLFGAGAPVVARSTGDIERIQLSAASWVDVCTGWLGGSDELLDRLLATVPWQQFRRTMYGRRVDDPRLTAWYAPGELRPDPVLDVAAAELGAHYGVTLGRLALNLYRDGADSVAWHGDRIGRTTPEPVIAIVGLGAPRPFLLRPRGGGPTRRLASGFGDLLVMGGRCQQEFEHAVPKVAHATPRLSVMFRQIDDRPSGDVVGVVRPRSTRTSSSPSSRVEMRPSSWAS